LDDVKDIEIEDDVKDIGIEEGNAVMPKQPSSSAK